jgi:hypothetical protein
MKLRNALLATALASVAFAPAAKADLIFSGVVNTTALGFGDVHRFLTIQEPTGQGNGIEAGSVTPTAGTVTPAVCTSLVDCGTDKSGTPTLTALGWTSGANVGVGVDISQTGSADGLNLNSIVINIYDPTGTTILDTFSLAAGGYIITDAAGHASGSGNGQGVFQFVLDAAQQAEFNSDLLNGNDVVGSSVNWGCSGTVNATTCQPANDGPDTLLGFKAAAVPGPVVGAGLPGLISACVGLWALHRNRRKRQVA